MAATPPAISGNVIKTEGFEARSPINHGRFFQLDRDTFHEAAHHPDGIGYVPQQINHDQENMRIKEVERPRDEEKREDDRDARYHLQKKESVGDAFLVAKTKASETVRGRDSDKNGEQGAANSDNCAVFHIKQDVHIVKNIVVVLQRRLKQPNRRISESLQPRFEAAADHKQVGKEKRRHDKQGQQVEKAGAEKRARIPHSRFFRPRILYVRAA